MTVRPSLPPAQAACAQNAGGCVALALFKQAIGPGGLHHAIALDEIARQRFGTRFDACGSVGRRFKQFRARP